jgi:hypothetical protein
MKKAKARMIGAYYNGPGGFNLHCFVERKITSRLRADNTRKVTHHPAKAVAIKTDKEGYFEFQDTKENRQTAVKLMRPSPKDGKIMIELDDEDLQEEILGEAIEVEEVNAEEAVVETQYEKPRFSGDGKKPLTQGQLAAIAKMQAGRDKKNAEKKKAKEEE